MVSAIELKARQDRLLQEQKARIERERQRQEKEAKLRALQAQREAQREEEIRLKRLAEEEAALLAQKKIEEETEYNRGVYLQLELQPVDADEAGAAARGIRRAGDKVLLPASVGASLMSQDAPRNGAMLFELTSAVTGARTHAGVLEFTAPEGTVALPLKVRECLFGPGAQCTGTVSVRYKRLEKGTFVRFQPLTRGFHEEVAGDDVRGVLETALMRYTTLTQGDMVHVEYGPTGRVYDMRVQELRPDPQVSIIDTDVEAEVVASEETERLIREWEERQRAAAEAAAAAQRDRERLAAEAVAAAEQAAREAEHAAAERARRAAEAAEARAALLVQREAALPPEPPAAPAAPAAASAASPSGTVVCAVRLPGGARVTRRFLLSDPVSLLFQFVDAKGGAGVAEDGAGELGYCLVAQFPRRVILRPAAEQQQGAGSSGMEVDAAASAAAAPPAAAAAGGDGAGAAADVTLEQAGLKAGQEALLVELLAPPE